MKVRIFAMLSLIVSLAMFVLPVLEPMAGGPRLAALAVADLAAEESHPVVALQTEEVALQQGFGYYGTTDTYLDRYEPDVNRGGSDRLVVAADGSQSALIRFDLSGYVPQCASISSAMLWVYPAKEVCPWQPWWGPRKLPMQVGAYQTLRAWVEREATWNRAAMGQTWGMAGANGPGTDYEPLPTDVVWIDTLDVWYRLDVTSMVQQWVNNPNSNYGLLLKGIYEGQPARWAFLSSNSGQSSHRPVLCIHYTPGSCAPSPVIRSISPAPPNCVLRNSPNLQERLLELRGENFPTTHRCLQFRDTATGQLSICFEMEVNWESTSRITLDMGRIKHLLFPDKRKVSLSVRLLDSQYRSISDWSPVFILADDATACGIATRTCTPTPTRTPTCTATPCLAIISGVVKDAQSKAPLPGVRVSIKTGQGDVSATTVYNTGTYQLSVRPGLYPIEFSKFGYWTQSGSIDLNSCTVFSRKDTYLVSQDCLPPWLSCAVSLMEAWPGPWTPLAIIASVLDDLCNIMKQEAHEDYIGSGLTVLKLLSKFVKVGLIIAGRKVIAVVECIMGLMRPLLDSYWHSKCKGDFSCLLSLDRALVRFLMEPTSLIMLIHILSSASPSPSFYEEAVLAMQNNQVELHIYDENANHLGLKRGEIEHTIANSYLFTLDRDYQIAVIGDATARYRIRIEGKDTASYNVVIAHPKRDGTLTEVSYSNLSTRAGSIAALDVTLDSNTYLLLLDYNGDGVTDRTVSPSRTRRVNLAVSGPSGLIGTVAERAIDLSWNVSTRSGLAGYKVYYGPGSGLYDAVVDVGNVTRYRLSDVGSGAIYCVVVSYDTVGVESSYSNEVFFRIPYKVFLPVLRKR